MILTGKAKEDFLKWFENKHDSNYTIKTLSLDLAKTTNNAIITDWFDSVGIYINVKNYRFIHDWSFSIKMPAKKRVYNERRH